jgi:transcription elongation factor GreA
MDAITAEGLVALKEELARLEGEERRTIAERILRARELGDLSENAEYHAAKEDQAHLETRILKLQDRLRNAQVTEVPTSHDVVVKDGTSGKEQAFTIVGATEADLKQGKLSVESPVAQALMGAKPGDTVKVSTPRGERAMDVVSLR